MKTCKICKKEKPLNDFCNSESLRNKPRCKSCVAEYDKEYRKNKRIDVKKPCISCGQPCCKVSKRCIKCAHSSLVKKQRPRHPKLCENCGKELAKRKYKLCHSCNMSKRWQDQDYRNSTIDSMVDSFKIRWADPVFKRKTINRLICYQRTSKLENHVAELAKQFGFKQSEITDKFIVDLKNEDNKIIVEVNGDLWHCNPKFWKADDIHPTKNITAKSIWDRDFKRKEYLELLGYRVYVIWEYDIKKGKDEYIIKFFNSLEYTKP